MKQNKRPRMRLLAAGLSCLLLLTLLTMGVSASGPEIPQDAVSTRVLVDGNEILAGDCVIYHSVTYVPLRKFCDLFADCEIKWDQKSATATVKTPHLSMTVSQGAVYIAANGHYYYTVEPIQNFGGSLYVPIRPLARAFALDLNWNAAEHCVELDTRGLPVQGVAWANYNDGEVYWLSRIISAEAGGEPFLGQIAVGNVVLNRMRHTSYPNTVYGVIFDRKHGTQFSPVAIGTVYRPPTKQAVIAAKICLEGYSLDEDILFFMNPRIATSSWISQNRTFAFSVGNHDFYY